MPTRRKVSSGRNQRERTNEATSYKDDAMFWSCGKNNRKKLAEMTSFGVGRITATNGYNLQRFDGGGGSLRMDFCKEVPTGGNICKQTGLIQGILNLVNLRHGNPEPISPNDVKVGGQVQRLRLEESIQ